MFLGLGTAKFTKMQVALLPNPVKNKKTTNANRDLFWPALDEARCSFSCQHNPNVTIWPCFFDKFQLTLWVFQKLLKVCVLSWFGNKKQQFCKAIKSVVWVFQKLLKVCFLSWIGNEKQQFCKAIKSVGS
jgi:hypothetical protein